MSGPGVEFNDYWLIWAEAAEAVREAVRETTTNIEQDVKGRAPVATPGGGGSGARSAPYRTGALRRSYHVDFKGTNGVQIEAHVGNDPGVAPYGIFVEFGTSKMAPRPHLTPSSEAQRAPHEARVVAAVREAARVAGKL